MNSKTNDILNDIIHTASQAILAEDEPIKRQALGDISCAIASLVPTEHAGVPAARIHDPADYWKVAEGVQLHRYKATNVTRLIAVRKGVETNPDVIFDIFINNTTKKATIKRDDTVLFTVGVDGLSPTNLQRAAISVLRSYLNHQVKEHRHGKERIHRRVAERKEAEMKALRVGILTPAAELAETVARQKEMDEPTTVGCPALRMMNNLPSGFDGVEPSSDDLENA